MVAVCPNCHDAIHHGEIEISDDTIREWKTLTRSEGAIRSHLYVEPGTAPKLLLGSITIVPPEGSVLFRLSDRNQLELAINQDGILLLNLSLSSRDGREILMVSDNYVRHRPTDLVQFHQVPGRVLVTTAASGEFIPDTLLAKVRQVVPDFGTTDRMTLLDVEVLKPGFVRVDGVWAGPEHAVVITGGKLMFIRVDRPRPTIITGEGEGTILLLRNREVGLPLFGFGHPSTFRI